MKLTVLFKHRRDAAPAPIGIPRALFYFLHPALWKTFFTEAGIPVVLSQPTDRVTVERAGMISESEHCLPVKLLDAHLDALAGRVDRVFIPRILAMRRGHIACPKLSALPDAARAQFGARISVVTIDVDENRRPLRKTLALLGRQLGVSGPVLATAIERAGEAMAAALQAAAPSPSDVAEAGGKRFLLIGHPYNLNDDFFSGVVCGKLARLGAAVERVTFDRDPARADPLKWDTCSLILEALKDLKTETCAGVIELTSFNCGCDSIAGSLFREVVRSKGIPFMALVLDEHSAPTGVDTRLEAFVDSIGQRP